MARVHRFTGRVAAVAAALLLAGSTAQAQWTEAPKYKVGGSPNMKVLGHIPLGGYFRVMDNEIEQDPSRPYAYVSQSWERAGFTIISTKDNQFKKLYSWTIDNPELHGGTGGMDGKYFKLKGKYYYVQSLQFGQSGPDADLGAVVADVTTLPDTTKIKIVARIREKEYLGGFHNIFAYKHSDGRVLLFTTLNGPYSNVYDMEKVVSGAPENTWLVGRVPIPRNANTAIGNFGYHDFQIQYDPSSHQDKFYGGGRGGYFIYDITNIGKEEPKLVTQVVGASGVSSGHTFTPTPDGKYAVAETEYQFAPLRIFDLQPGLEGKVNAISQPVGAWTSDWRALSHNHEIKWPYVFVSAYEDGLQIFNMADPANPFTVGWYFTCQCTHMKGFGGVPQWYGNSVFQGAFGVKVRDYDGLIVISDTFTGFWALKLDGFDNWNGNDWGMPNISSTQDWDNGPVGAPRRAAATGGN
ncbi:MAG: hypothetical protein R2882_09035 [Gemmatimonadales bacterium]